MSIKIHFKNLSYILFIGFVCMCVVHTNTCHNPGMKVKGAWRSQGSPLATQVLRIEPGLSDLGGFAHWAISQDRNARHKVFVSEGL